MKQLTIAIPAYNSEKFISKCLDSFIEYRDDSDSKNVGISDTDVIMKTSSCDEGRIDQRLDIIVVDDGSKDDTKKIVEEYAAKYPDVIRLISKENGGHGSAINTAIKVAEGRYFKAVDSDDWVIQKNISSILDEIEKTDADVIITGYISVNEKNGKKQVYSSKCEHCGKNIGMDEFAEVFESIPASFQYHGLAYNTSFYKSLGLYLSEGVYYEDQEYAILPFLKAATIRFIPYDLYVYRIGSNEQSVSNVNMQNRLGDLKAVLKKLMDKYNTGRMQGVMDGSRDLFFKKRLAIAFNSFFAITLIKTDDKKAGRKEAEGFMQFIEANNKEMAERIEPKYALLSKLSKIPGVANTYTHMMNSGLYLSVKRFWTK